MRNNKAVSDSDPVLTYLAQVGLPYVDLRDKKDCLWIIGGLNIINLLAPIRSAGVFVGYKSSGVNVTQGRPAWYITEDTSSVSIPEKGTKKATLSRSKLPACPAEASPPDGQRRNAFVQWLSSQGYSDHTCSSYASAIAIVSDFAKEHSYITKPIYAFDDAIMLRNVWETLLNDTAFLEYNQRQHNRFSAAMRLYLFFLKSTIQLPEVSSGEVKRISSTKTSTSATVLRRQKEFKQQPNRADNPSGNYAYTDENNDQISMSDSDIMQRTRQPLWDMYEAAILLDGYLKTKQKKEPKSHTIKRISDDLRTMAVNRGIRIDSVYRNENGISYQLQSMESAFCGRTIYVPATKLFLEIVNLYKNDHERYLDTLEKAKRMVESNSNNKEAFLSWAATIVPAGKYKWIDSNIHQVEQFGINSKQISSTVYDITEIAVLENLLRCVRRSKIFRIKYKKIYNQILADFSLYIRFCLHKSEEDDAENLVCTSNTNALQSNPLAEKTDETHVDAGIVSVLKQHYQYGFRVESIRELIRFRQFAEEMSIKVPEDDELLKAAILASGTLIDDKVYCKNDNLPDELCDLTTNIFDTGVEVIYYECLFQRESDWMSSHVITSEDMLKEYLQRYVGGCSFLKRFFVKGEKATEKDAVTAEIIRVWGNSQTESVEVLSYRLPYIPIGNIWRVVSGNDFFVLSSEGVYLRLDRFHITEDEENDILVFVKTACDQKGFASLSDVPLGDIAEENYELSPRAIYNAIYKKVLSSKYHLNRRILTVDKPELDAIVLLKQYISDKEMCSFDEVADKVIELTGGTNRQYAFQALYDEMVRTGPNSFVATSKVDFNVDEIDKILSGFITDHFLAIRDITTFAMFPISGQNWNHYLLESYCYKYSRKYSLHVLHFNDKNAGIIAEKEYGQQYTEMLAIALAREDVELSSAAAGSYLFNAGYMAKSKYARLEEIVQRAKEIRGKR